MASKIQVNQLETLDGSTTINVSDISTGGVSASTKTNIMANRQGDGSSITTDSYSQITYGNVLTDSNNEYSSLNSTFSPNEDKVVLVNAKLHVETYLESTSGLFLKEGSNIIARIGDHISPTSADVNIGGSFILNAKQNQSYSIVAYIESTGASSANVNNTDFLSYFQIYEL